MYVSISNFKMENTNNIQITKDKNHPLMQIYNRQKSLNGKAFIEVFSVDDTKQKKNSIKSTHLDLSKTNFETVLKKTKEFNKDTQAVFINLNPLSAPKRNKSNIKRIQYVFIDLDDAQTDHNEIILTNLEKLKIKYSYNCKSGSGFHVLIPISLCPTQEPKIKGFLKHLKANFCDKVDLATADTPRLFRVPESIHNKKDPFRLKTLNNFILSEQEITENSDLILKYQAEIILKGKKNTQYKSSVVKEDIFFQEILFNTTRWAEYYKHLDNSKERNNVFIKNLGTHISNNINDDFDASAFIKGWEPARVAALEGWAKKAKENNMTTNYLELLKWAIENKIEDWIELLKKQTQTTFLDKYEFYYLEDEKTDNAYLLYFPENNYYVQKSLFEVLNNVYYDCLESGVNLVEEFGLECIEEWKDYNIKKQQSIIFNQIHKKIIIERRIKKVFNINYEPSDEKFVFMDNKKFFNTYNKTELWDNEHKTKSKRYEYDQIKE